jgi:hypothetical protein
MYVIGEALHDWPVSKYHRVRPVLASAAAKRPVVRIVRAELKVPAQLSGLGVQCDHGSGIEIVASTLVAIAGW